MAKRECTKQQQQQQQQQPTPLAKRAKLTEESISLEVQPFEWKTSTLDKVVSTNDPLLVRCWCKDVEGRVTLLLFRGFSFTVYLELPTNSVDGRSIGWNSRQIDSLKSHTSALTSAGQPALSWCARTSYIMQTHLL